MNKHQTNLKRKPLTLGLAVLLTTLSASVPGFAYDFKGTHTQQGVECNDCHQNDRKAIIPNEKCLACHQSYAELGKKTADMERNPHMSPHFLDVECTSCHQGHKVLNNLCQDCHGPITRDKHGH